MSFDLYPDLPLEIRRQIIKEAATTSIAERPREERLSALATIDPDWKQVIQGMLFKHITISIPSDLDDFETICGRHNGLLKRITCNFDPWNDTNFPTAPVVKAAFIAAISRLFNIMQNWNRPDRKTLITVCIRVCIPNGGNRYRFAIESSDLVNLPEVAVIGRMYAQLGFERDVLLSHDTITDLHVKLPNLQGVQLALPTATGAELWENARDTHGK